MIELRNLHVTFNQGSPLAKTALNGLDLAIEAGEFITVIGSNGAGKSTMLNTILGAVLPERGSVLVGNENVTSWPIWRRTARIGHVSQDPRLGSYEDLTIAENIAIASRRGQGRGLRLAIRRAERDSFASMLRPLGLGLEDRLDTRVSLLSGGQRQALSLVMTTVRPMDVLLLDEHTSALDPKMAGTISSITEEIVQEHKLTTLMVTHSMQQALSMGTRTVMLHDGAVLLDISGERRDQTTIPDLLAQFDSLGDVLEDRMLLG